MAAMFCFYLAIALNGLMVWAYSLGHIVYYDLFFLGSTIPVIFGSYHYDRLASAYGFRRATSLLPRGQLATLLAVALLIVGISVQPLLKWL